MNLELLWAGSRWPFRYHDYVCVMHTYWKIWLLHAWIWHATFFLRKTGDTGISKEGIILCNFETKFEFFQQLKYISKHRVAVMFVAQFMARCTRFNIMWESLSVTCDMSVVFSTNKTDRHDITEILLKVALNNINLNQ